MPWTALLALLLSVLLGENRLDLELVPDGRHEVRGRVLGSDGEPVADADVLAQYVWSTTSAADGSFTLRVEEGTHVVWADREGYARAEETLIVDGGPAPELVLRLPRAGTVRGRLLGLSRAALAEARVELIVSPNVRRSRVDAQGDFRLEGVPPGEWPVTAIAGRRFAHATVEVEGGGEAALDISFPPTSEVRGRLVVPGGEVPAGAEVRAVQISASGGSTQAAACQPDGSFRLELEEGTHLLFATARGLTQPRGGVPRVAATGAPVEIEVPMRRAIALRGRILGLGPGEPAPRVWAESENGIGEEAEMDQESGYVFPTLSPGRWTISVTYGSLRVVREVILAEGQEESFLDLEIPPDTD